MTHLQVAQLSKLLPTVVKLTSEGLDLLMDNFVGAYVATLREGLATDIAAVGPLACVASLVCLTKSVAMLRQSKMLLTLRLPSWEKRWPQDGALQTYAASVEVILPRQELLTNGFAPVCARMWISKCVFW